MSILTSNDEGAFVDLILLPTVTLQHENLIRNNQIPRILPPSDARGYCNSIKLDLASSKRFSTSLSEDPVPSTDIFPLEIGPTLNGIITPVIC